MPVKNETSTRFMDEVRIISPWAYLFAILGFLMPFAALVYATLSGNPPMPLAAMVPLAIVGGTILGCYVLLIGYVNRDAGRRGMSRLGWTLLAIFIPNALGIVLYFVLRKPHIATCPQCGAPVQSGYGYCPKCGKNLGLHCPRCQHAVHADDVYCAYCGNPLTAADPSLPAQQPQQS